MIGWSGWKTMASSAASILANLVGQDIVARSISLTQAAASVAVQLVTGAQLKLGTGTTDYLTSNGTTTITAAGNFTVTGTTTSAGVNSSFDFNNTGPGGFNASGTGAGHYLISGTSAANAGATAATAALILYPANVLDATDWVVTVGNGANAASLFAINHAGSIVLPTTDSSGTPGAATIDKPTGRSAIALGAASVVVTNALVTAASHVFISPRTRDATGLLPLVTTIGAGSFTVSVTANTTAALTFDWFVIT